MARYPKVTSCPCRKCSRRRAQKLGVVTKLHSTRRRAGRCIAHPRRKAFKGGRCRACWREKLAGERQRYAERAVTK